VEEKANGEKARMGMVVCLDSSPNVASTHLQVYTHTQRCPCTERSLCLRLGKGVEVEKVEQVEENDANTSFVQVIRGNSVVLLEALERIGGDDRRGGGDHRG